MDRIWQDMGFPRWPLAFSLVVVTLLGLWSAYRLFIADERAMLKTKAWVDAILFWGGFAVLAGVLGTLVGVTIAAHSIEAAGAASQTLVWGGIKVAMLSSLFGLLIMAWAALIWFVLQLRWRLLEARELEAS